MNFFLSLKKYNRKNPIVCEIGTWKGKSAYVFAKALKEIDGSLFCIDPFNGEGDSVSKKEYESEISKLNITLLENFERTIKQYDLLKNTNILVSESKTARKNFKESTIDVLFIDGNHNYQSVKEDYELWSPLIVSGGKIILHDVKAKHVDGPRLVMNNFILNNPIWKDIKIVGEMGLATKT